jgi:hypothetical protein
MGIHMTELVYQGGTGQEWRCVGCDDWHSGQSAWTLLGVCADVG